MTALIEGGSGPRLLSSLSLFNTNKQMLKRFLYLLAVIAVGFVPFLVTHAQTARFALVAISPTGQKTVCVERASQSVLNALGENGFTPKQDDTGFIYSLIGHDGPVSTDPAAQAAFWGFWWASGDNLGFSDRGPAEVVPQTNNRYVFSFGNGTLPSSIPSFQSVCPDPVQPAAAPVNNSQSTSTPAPVANPSGPTLQTSINYLRTNFAAQALANRDWGAMALGANGVSVATGTTADPSVLSLARNALGKAAQGQERTSLVDQIKASYAGGQLGESTLISDDIFGVLAIQATDPAWLRTRTDIFQTILSSQRSDGSFGYSESGDGDADMTAAAVWALVYAPTYPTDVIARAFNYLNAARASDGGYGYRPGAAASVATSSWVLLAYRATDTAFPALETYLHNQRQADGSYLQSGQPNYLNTAYAVLALSGQRMPIVPAATPNPTPAPTPSPTPKPTTSVYGNGASAIERTYTETNDFGCSASAAATATGTAASATAIAVCW